MDEDSKLSEPIPSRLLKENSSTVILLDSSGNISSRYEVQGKLPSRYSFDPSSFLPNTEPLTLDRFFSLVQQTLDRLQEVEGVKPSERVSIVEEYPPNPIQDLSVNGEAITYKVISRKPGSNDPSGTGRIQRKSTYSYDLHSADSPNKVVIVESRPVDHIVEFSCWAKTNKRANYRAVWLEKALIANAWVFETHGAERFFWRERLSDNVLLAGQQRLHQRPLRFDLRFREFEISSHPALRKIDFDVSLLGK